MPPVLLLRVRHCLSRWPAVTTSALIPAAGAATMAHLFWWASRGSGTEVLPTFLYLAYLLVPDSITVGVFWCIYALLTGRRFLEPPAWPRG